MKPGVRAVIALGCNVGDCASTLDAARRAIRALPDVTVLGAVADERTAAVSEMLQPDYLNGMLVVRTSLAPAALLAALHAIEAAHGRTRPERHAPRTLDLDLVWIEGVTSDDPALVLPHPAFVARPWLRTHLAALVGAGVTASAIDAIHARAVADPRDV